LCIEGNSTCTGFSSHRCDVRYASLFFVAGVENDANELMVLEILHRYVEVLDRYFGNVCELDLIFNFNKVGISTFQLYSSFR
jgi:hypothetical protein